jgi:hypothetical protein
MRRRIIAATAVALASLATAGPALAGTPGVATTNIKPVGVTKSGTGYTQAPKIHATVVTTDTGNSINSTGYGTGFRTQGLYVSVLYENGSKSSGPNQCLPAGNVNFGDRIIGAWVPDGSTTRVLAPVTEIGQAYYGTAGASSGGQLDNWDNGTVSVRRVDLVKPPTLYANLQACGRVHRTGDALATNLFTNGLSASEGIPQLPVVPTLASLLKAPVSTPTAPVKTIVKTVVKTVTAPAPPAVTITAPAVTVKTPAVTVTVPSLSRR